GELFASLANDSGLVGRPAGLEFLRQLITVIGAQNRPADVTRSIAQLADWKNLDVVFPLASALAEGLKRANTSLTAVDTEGRMNALFQRAKPIAIDGKQPRPV